MQDTQRKEQIHHFVETWTSRGDEKGESQAFWLSLLRDVLGVERPEEFISFENRVKLSNTSFIDGYLDRTRVMIEQKSIDKDLRAPIRQSDGTLLTPFQQAKRYSFELPVSKHPRWIVTCNFRSFLIYDMEQPQGEPTEVLLENLEKEYHRLSFLTDTGDDHLRHEMQISLKAGEMVGLLYDAFMKQFGDGELGPRQFHSLNALCVRLVFCLYAEDAGVFEKDQFYHYMKTFQTENMRIALRDLFQVLDTPVSERDPFLEPKLKAFPYVNGFLFRLQPSEFIPPITQETADLLLEHASIDFDWSEISPTIFGAVFESTLNPETRRSGGMHYTSIENIHKVIDPLFMDDLNAEFLQLKQIPVEKKRREALAQFQDKLSQLRFFDPACGSGNFLTESYISLRRLENKVIEAMTHGQTFLGFEEVNPIKVSLKQFFGIEINDFAVTVATTALWIAEAQMMTETERIIKFNLEYLPLKRYSNIHEGNALRMDWKEVVPYTKINYIIGNPPFVGARLMSAEQKDDMIEVFGKKWKNVGNLDYVCCWYKRVAELMDESAKFGNTIRAALVSTNSITQGEQVANLWQPLMDGGVHIDFAYRTFRWDSESTQKAHVHCVIVGFSKAENKKERFLFDESGNKKDVENINGYLIDGPNVSAESRSKALCAIPDIGIGNKPIDGGNYLFKKDEMEEFIKAEPLAKSYFHRWYGATEFINNEYRYCLWLGECSPAILRSMPHCLERVKAVQDFRLASSSAGTRKLAERPTRFHVENQPKGNYIIVPRHSSENRRYIPLGFMTPDNFCGDANMMIPDASIYHFGVLTSNVHMAWVRATCGRIKSDYRYSKDIVYNNFPWPSPTDEQKARIEHTAQAILDARALYPDCSLADLYDEVTMPPELRRAHQDNDRAVMAAYGFPVKDFTESDCVAHLLTMYQELTK